MKQAITNLTFLLCALFLSACNGGGSSAPPENRAPIADAGTDIEVEVKELVTLDGRNSHDPDNDTIEYKWLQISGPVTQLSSDVDDTPSFIAPNEETIIRYQLVATDGKHSSAPDTITITVAANEADNDGSSDSGSGSDGNSTGGNPTGNNSSGGNTGNNNSNDDSSNDDASDSNNQDTNNDNGNSDGNNSGSSDSDNGDSDNNNSGNSDSDNNDTGSNNSDDNNSDDNNSDGNNSNNDDLENLAPIANAGADLTINGDELAQLDASASSDPENDTLSYLWTQISGTAVTLNNSEIENPSFTAPNISDTLSFSLVVNDGNQNSVSDEVNIIITRTNYAPTANAGNDDAVSGEETFTLNATGSSDPNNDALSYLWNQISGTIVTLDDNTSATPSFTAPNLNETLTFSLIVNDGSLDSSADEVSIQINQVNHAPTANAGNDATINGEELYTLDASGSSDSEGDSLSYQWSQTSGTSVSLNDANIEFPTFLAPNVDETLTFSLIVNDGSLNSLADSVSITINSVNHQPIANAGEDIEINANASVSLDGSASTDEDGDPLSYLWQQTSGTTVELSDNTSPTLDFVAPDNADSLSFSLTVSDGELTSLASTVNVNVLAPDTGLNANAGADQQVKSSVIVSLDGSSSFADDGSPLSYTWRQSGGPSVILSSLSEATPTFTAPIAPEDTQLTLSFNLIVSDGISNSSIDSVLIVVDDRNTAPVADAGTAQALEGDNTVYLDGSLSSDPDGDTITFQWVQTSGPAITLLYSDTDSPEFHAPREGGEFQFSLVVNDGELDSNSDLVNISVTPANNAPIANAGVDRYVGSSSVVALKGIRSSDPDGDAITYQWQQTSGPTITLSDTTAANPTFEAHTDGLLVFSLIVSDGRLDSPADSVNVTVGPIPATNIKVNGTGITWGANYPTGNNLDCSGEAVEQQDCSLGRELTHNDNTDGRAGFSFKKIDSDGVDTDSSNPEWACVQDAVTGLMWETKTGGNDVVGDEGLNDADDKYSWYNPDASSNGGAEGFSDSKGEVCYGYDSESPSSYCNSQAFVDRMNAEGWCGYADWRLPTRKELLSIVDYGNAKPMLDNDYFPSNAALTWTSTPFAIGTTSAWGVNFDHGNSFSLDKRNANQVRLVRGGYDSE